MIGTLWNGLQSDRCGKWINCKYLGSMEYPGVVPEGATTVQKVLLSPNKSE